MKLRYRLFQRNNGIFFIVTAATIGNPAVQGKRVAIKHKGACAAVEGNVVEGIAGEIVRGGQSFGGGKKQIVA